ncbi:MAG: DUF5706 domain-containing protein [Gammaproteobacteria bacterium]|nr:DUF5706 domain-containing protein [Gammaproteobacteria bacterium]
MNTQEQPASYAMKLDFIRLVLDSEDKRRQSLDNKAIVLLTSNTILVSAISVLGAFQLKNSPGSSSSLAALLGPQYIWFVITLFSAVISVLAVILAIMPIPGWLRRLIMDLKPDCQQFFFEDIAHGTKSDYIHDMSMLGEQDIICQLAADIHNVARILRLRYYVVDLAIVTFVLGMISFAVFVSNW